MPDATRTLELLTRANDGDKAALNRVLGRYWERVRRIVRSRVGKRVRRVAESSDIMQETLMVAVTNWEKYEIPDEASLVRLLVRIAEHKITDYADKASSQKNNVDIEVPIDPGSSDDGRPAPEPQKQETSVLDRTIRHERQEMVDECLSDLPEPYRQLIELRCYQHLSWAEVGEQTGKTENAARMAFAKAKVALIRMIRERGGLDSSEDQMGA